MRRPLLSLLLLVACGGVLLAQTESASLWGRVTDPTGAAVVGAAVTITNLDTNAVANVQTNGTGNFVFPNLAPGRYTLTVRAQGFRQYQVQGLVLHVQDRLTHDATLQVGTATETIEVTAETQPINVENATVGSVIERQTIANMPLNGRSFQGLITLTPGVATVPASPNNAGQFVVNGQRTDANYFTVDGVSANTSTPILGNTLINGTGAAPATSSTGGFNNMVSVDALEEFRISTSSFAPEFGRAPGGQISLVSRGGSNSFHGDVFDYLRNTVLDANDWFLNAAGKPRGVVQQNDFGGVFGGPIVRNKLFFFASYEGLRLKAPSSATKSVPTQDMRNKAAAANANGVVGYMAQFWNAYPLPTPGTAASATCTSAANCIAPYIASFPGAANLDATSVRLDYTLSHNMNVFGRWSRTPSDAFSSDSVKTTTTRYLNDFYTAGWTTAITNTLTNDARFNFTHGTYVNGNVPNNFAGSLSTIFPSGYAQPPSDLEQHSYALQWGFTGIDTLIIAPHQRNHGNDQINVTDSVSWAKGTHHMKFGVDFRQLSPAADQSNQNNNFTFTGTTCPGSTLPGFICGIANLANIQHLVPMHFRIRQYSAYAQDTWRITDRLTATYGVRWDLNPPVDYLTFPVFAIDPDTWNPADARTMKVLPLGAATFETRWANFAPRLGLAYQLSRSNRWARVVRAGYGVFYDSGANAAATVQGPYSARCNNLAPCTLPPYTGPAIATVPFPVSVANQRFVVPPVFPDQFTFPISQGTDQLIDPRFSLPYVHEMNLTLEQQIAGRQSLEIGYVGALGRHLLAPVLYPPNRVNPAYLGNGTVGDTLTVFRNAADSEYHALVTKFQRQFSHGLGAIVSYTWSHSIDTQSTGNSVNLNGVSTQAFLPTAAELAAGLPSFLRRASSDFDIRHNFGFSVVYEAPTPRQPLARALLGHWTLAPIYHYQGAMPLDVIANATATIGGATGVGQRPMLIPGVPIYVTGSDCVAQYAASGRGSICPGGRALNAAPVSASAAASVGCLAPTTSNAKGAFCTPAPVGGQAISGNAGRNILRGFPLQELDFSVHRDFPFKERFRLRFQADLFNVFNHPNFGPPGSNVSATNFGFSGAMANSFLGGSSSSGAGFNPVFSTGAPRNAQFALKLFF